MTFLFPKYINAFKKKFFSNVYLSPLLPLINRTLSKFVFDNVKEGLIITPLWFSKQWVSSLLTLLLLILFAFLRLYPGCSQKLFQRKNSLSGLAYWMWSSSSAGLLKEVAKTTSRYWKKNPLKLSKKIRGYSDWCGKNLSITVR